MGHTGPGAAVNFRLGLKRAPPDVDRAEIEAPVEARRQAWLQRKEDPVVVEGPVEMPPDWFW
jgi:hypothetical protein